MGATAIWGDAMSFRKISRYSLGKRIVFLFACFMGILWGLCGCSPTYSSFMNRDEKYFSELSRACDALLALSKKNQLSNAWVRKETPYSMEWIVAGNEKSLPMIVKELHANNVGINFNRKSENYRLWIMVGATRPGFGVSWSQNDYGNGNNPWELSVDADGLRKVVYAYKP